MSSSVPSFDPVVSVIIPTRHRPALVLRAIRSVLVQSVSNLEVIVVIDGPDSSTGQALETIQDSRLRVLSLPQHIGGSETRNRGVHVARGRWVAFLDDDDEWLTRKLELQLQLAERLDQPNFMVTCRLLAITPRANYEWPRRFPEASEPLSEYLLTRDSFFRGERSIQTSTFFAKRELFTACPFRPGQLKHQDTDWLLRVAKLPGFAVFFVDEVLAHHYVEEERATTSSASNWRYSFDWARQNRELFTPRSYSGFIINNVAPEASDAKAVSAIFPLAVEFLRFGNPRFREICVFIAMFLFSRPFRRRLRDFLNKFRPALLRRL
ncbi:MAG: glycosyltransferase family 2 protein [Candidatus Acidiferrum sp.]